MTNNDMARVRVRRPLAPGRPRREGGKGSSCRRMMPRRHVAACRTPPCPPCWTHPRVRVTPPLMTLRRAGCRPARESRVLAHSAGSARSRHRPRRLARPSRSRRSPSPLPRGRRTCPTRGAYVARPRPYEPSDIDVGARISATRSAGTSRSPTIACIVASNSAGVEMMPPSPPFPNQQRSSVTSTSDPSVPLVRSREARVSRGRVERSSSARTSAAHSPAAQQLRDRLPRDLLEHHRGELVVRVAVAVAGAGAK